MDSSRYSLASTTEASKVEAADLSTPVVTQGLSLWTDDETVDLGRVYGMSVCSGTIYAPRFIMLNGTPHYRIFRFSPLGEYLDYLDLELPEGMSPGGVMYVSDDYIFLRYGKDDEEYTNNHPRSYAIFSHHGHCLTSWWAGSPLFATPDQPPSGIRLDRLRPDGLWGDALYAVLPAPPHSLDQVGTFRDHLVVRWSVADIVATLSSLPHDKFLDRPNEIEIPSRQSRSFPFPHPSTTSVSKGGGMYFSPAWERVFGDRETLWIQSDDECWGIARDLAPGLTSLAAYPELEELKRHPWFAHMIGDAHWLFYYAQGVFRADVFVTIAVLHGATEFGAVMAFRVQGDSLKPQAIAIPERIEGFPSSHRESAGWWAIGIIDSTAYIDMNGLPYTFDVITGEFAPLTLRIPKNLLSTDR